MEKKNPRLVQDEDRERQEQMARQAHGDLHIGRLGRAVAVSAVHPRPTQCASGRDTIQ